MKRIRRFLTHMNVIIQSSDIDLRSIGTPTNGCDWVANNPFFCRILRIISRTITPYIPYPDVSIVSTCDKQFCPSGNDSVDGIDDTTMCTNSFDTFSSGDISDGDGAVC